MPAFTTADGRTLAYRRLGVGPVLVCHPGGPGAPAELFADLGGLDRDRTLVQLSPRGVGKSDLAETYGLEDYTADLDELRAHLELKQMDLFGHSAGGFVSMVYASTHPSRVRKVVLSGTFARFSDEFRAAFERFLAEREDDPRFADAVAARRKREEDPPDDEEELGALALRGLPLLFGRYGEPEQALIDGLIAEGATFHTPALRYFNERVAPTFDLRPLLGEIEAPTLVITGELDPWGAGAAPELGLLIGGAKVVILPGVGHMPWIEDPRRFRAELVEFLSG
jgi:pimeloyl-ACP methyl ester carboxylesterase